MMWKNQPVRARRLRITTAVPTWNSAESTGEAMPNVPWEATSTWMRRLQWTHSSFPAASQWRLFPLTDIRGNDNSLTKLSQMQAQLDWHCMLPRLGTAVTVKKLRKRENWEENNTPVHSQVPWTYLSSREQCRRKRRTPSLCDAQEKPSLSALSHKYRTHRGGRGLLGRTEQSPVPVNRTQAGEYALFTGETLAWTCSTLFVHILLCKWGKKPQCL